MRQCPYPYKPFPWSRPSPTSLPTEYETLRRDAPLTCVAARDGRDVWIATDYSSVKAILSHPDLSSDFTHVNYPPVFPSPGTRRIEDPIPDNLPYSALNGREHKWHRHKIRKAYSIEAMIPYRAIWDRLAHTQLKICLAKTQPIDWMDAFIVPYSLSALADFLDIDGPSLSRLAHLTAGSLGEAGCDPVDRPAIETIVRSLLKNAQLRSSDCVLGQLITAYNVSTESGLGPLIPFATSLITAGIEALIRTLSLSFVFLADDEPLFSSLKRDPNLIATSVEECLRLSSVADIVTARFAPKDILVHGISIPTGSGLVACLAAANRDPDMFSHPEEFLFRETSHLHLAFGFGAHRCLGQHLARGIMRAALHAVVTDCDYFHLADMPCEPWHGVMPGLKRLPVLCGA